MNPDLWLMTAALLLCILFSAFFSASETAYSALNKPKLKAMHSAGNRRAGRAIALAERYDQLLTTILVGNNLVNIAATAIATVLFTQLIGRSGPTWATAVMTLVVLIFGEVSPKTIAKENPERFAIWAAPLLQGLITLLTPVNALFVRWRALLHKLYKPQAEENYVEEELINIVEEAQHEGDMDDHEGDLIRSAIEFNDQDASGILTPRVDITALEESASLEEAERVFLDTGYSRIPVYREDLDHITGVLHEKDFYVKRNAGVQTIAEMMKPPVFAPETLKVSKLLKLFQSTKTHLVVIVDDFGGTEGIVTMEDVLEELVGEIYDEHDEVNEEVISLADGSHLIDGGMALSELMERAGIADWEYEADTVGGWAAEILGAIPKVGDTFEANGYACEITGMDKRRVTEIRIQRIPETKEGETKP